MPGPFNVGVGHVDAADTAVLFFPVVCANSLSYIRAHPAFKRQDRLGKDPFAGFGTVVEDITESGYTKNQPILLGAF